MPTKPSPLLCELHAHSTWSDGSLTLRELCDLYGRRGFDVLAVTDHAPREPREIHAGNYDAYLRAIRAEALRARELYDLLVIPGLELTYDDPDPLRAAHAVAIGLRSYVDVAAGLEAALASARAHGAPPPSRRGPSSTSSSTGSSCSTGTRSSRGSRPRGCRRSRAATSTGSTTWRPGRRCCRARRTSRR